MKTSLKCIEINPNTEPKGSVIWLHGLGADGSDFVPIVPELNVTDLALRFIFPSAKPRPVSVNNGYIMPAWFDIYSLSDLQRIDAEGIQATMQEIEKIIASEIQRGIPASNIILAGFSQGAVMALITGLKYDEKIAGIMALSGFLPASDKFLSQIHTEKKTIPIFIAHGTVDMTVPYFLGEKTAQLFKKNNFNVEFHSYPMGHSVCAEEIAEIGNWLRQTLSH